MHFDHYILYSKGKKNMRLMLVAFVVAVGVAMFAYKKYGKTSVQTFFHYKSKSIIDEIDKVLADHYGFTQEELDFIINYDIKYRMGRELNN